ncbi:uncharacterized protein FFB20_09678 [Fusarium fujikuroi]|uniref:Uncharacterized protein n=2 Tax=Fusarium fujikuroi TaxID=5127 RepID=S0E5H9_GIBF5|nr:uncharacterized protein FFUJ_06091 [Fusarium fujikuroi IMI 58289]QGI66000.1 hypothetical protein CEK27_009971 [Fusarium fujikuroi]QGI83239.1 hypothetical protein CEK25_009968 [Fusarium fujikuroi]QGI96881.1 hypothetical protein CEK26_009950 [Fusarium fujikuroi]CCT70144.1 uncharacterized protein FFUJ_06091 [Fusarium fujikuroi IMI 58289]SCN82297.1 uncharacterized protein FFE2_05037 [Fusarium fujikuroi]
MTSFFTVNNNVSLVSITIAPSTYLITVALLLLFAIIYIPRLLACRFPNLGIPLPSLASILRPILGDPTDSQRHPAKPEKALPEPPYAATGLVFEDQQQLVISGQDIVLAQRRHYLQQQQLAQQQRLLLEKQKQLEFQEVEYRRRRDSHQDSSPSKRSTDNGSPRRSRRQLTGLRSPTKSITATTLSSSQRSSNDRRGSRGVGDRFRDGFWRAPQQGFMHRGMSTLRESSPELDDSEDDGVLERAIRTRLPRGSQSPGKGRSMSPEKTDDPTIQFQLHEKTSPSRELSLHEATPDNYIRFAVRAEVQHRTEPIETAINFMRDHYKALTRTWSTTFTTIIIAFFSVSIFKSLLQPAAPRPVGDLVKVAGLARSFEPLIYYSEHAVSQVHDLQATSVAVWDLGESVRTSEMRDAPRIVADLDALSETMKTLAIEMTKFFARVDGDIDGILNVMDWAKMHLNRLKSSPSPSTISSAYDNIHNLLSQAHVLEDASGSPTTLGRLASHIFGLSNPQREQRMVQLLFTEFLSVLEDSIQAELQHSVTLFALFEAVDHHFLNLARTVVRESSAQEELHADMLSSLWTRLLGTRSAELRKFEQNRLLLRDVREKTVRNKGILVEHNGKLLTLKASLETLRSKLVSPLVRGVNSTTLTLEDQIRGLSDVSDYLGDVRKQQKGKVMETLFGSVPSKKYAIEDRPGTVVVNPL